MGQFLIKGTNFGVDIRKSSFSLKRIGPMEFELNIDIRGDQHAYDSIADTEEWSWTLDPPEFYLRGHRLRSKEVPEIAEVRSDAIDTERSELALYMMEHNAVSDLVVRVVDGRELSVSGTVDFLGDAVEFRIQLRNEPSAV